MSARSSGPRAGKRTRTKGTCPSASASADWPPLRPPPPCTAADRMRARDLWLADGGLAYAVAQPARRTAARAAACTQDSEGRAYVQRTPHATHPATQALRGAPEHTGQTIEYRGIQSSSPRMSTWRLSVGRIRRSSCREQTWYCDVTTLEARPGSALHALHVVHDAWDGMGLGGPSGRRAPDYRLGPYGPTYLPMARGQPLRLRPAYALNLTLTLAHYTLRRALEDILLEVWQWQV